MLSGLISAEGNTQDLADNMDEAIEYTLSVLNQQRAEIFV